MKNLLLLLFYSVSFQVLQAQEQSFTLLQAIDYAKQNSQAVKSQLIKIAQAKQDIRETKSIGLPNVSGKIDYTHFLEIPTSLIPAEIFGGTPGTFQAVQFGVSNNVSGSINANWLAFDATYFVGLRAAKTLNVYRQEELSKVNYDAKNDVTRAYLGILSFQQNIKTLSDNIENLQKVLKETKAYYENGFAEELDVERLTLSLGNLTSEKSNLESQVDVLKNTLKMVMGYPMTQTINLNDNFETLIDEAKSLDISQELDFSKRPEINLLETTKKLNELDLERYKMGYYPNLSIFATYSQTLQSNNLFDKNNQLFPTTLLGANVNIPIFDGFYKSAKIEKVKLSLEDLAIARQQTENGIYLEYVNAKTNYSNALNRLIEKEKNLKLANKIYDITKLKYKEGIGSSIEVTQAEKELYDTQSHYINAVYQLILEKTNFEKALGL